MSEINVNLGSKDPETIELLKKFENDETMLKIISHPAYNIANETVGFASAMVVSKVITNAILAFAAPKKFIGKLACAAASAAISYAVGTKVSDCWAKYQLEATKLVVELYESVAEKVGGANA